MKRFVMLTLSGILCNWSGLQAQTGLERDTIKTSGGALIVTFIGHGSLMLQYGGKTIYIDPFSRLTDYGGLPKSDLVLITHQHQDHLDPKALEKIRPENAPVLLPENCASEVEGSTVIGNGERKSVAGLEIEAVPAYNLVHKRDGGGVFHPKGEGNGYILTFGRTRLYVAGDTENTPEMKALKGIDYAFLPMNLPYTMTPEMVADAAKAFRPKVLYPYHYGETDPQKLVDLLKGEKGIEVRIRKMK
jgi:L-ascorbate metabolism protein UlaG (beta-lactamase superfamily)